MLTRWLEDLFAAPLPVLTALAALLTTAVLGARFCADIALDALEHDHAEQENVEAATGAFVEARCSPKRVPGYPGLRTCRAGDFVLVCEMKQGGHCWPVEPRE